MRHTIKPPNFFQNPLSVNFFSGRKNNQTHRWHSKSGSSSVVFPPNTSYQIWIKHLQNLPPLANLIGYRLHQFASEQPRCAFTVCHCRYTATHCKYSTTHCRCPMAHCKCPTSHCRCPTAQNKCTMSHCKCTVTHCKCTSAHRKHTTTILNFMNSYKLSTILQ